MKRIAITLTVLLASLMCFQANAQNVMQKGTNLVSVGLGITNNRVPISAVYDRGIVDNLFDSPDAALSVGAMAGASLGKGYNGFLIGPRAGIHYHFIPELDTYMSLMLGLESGRYSTSNNGEVTNTGWVNNLGWGIHVGTRYFITPQVGLCLELGYGYSFANIGVAFKL